MRNYLLTITMLLLVCCVPLQAQDYSKMSRYVRERVHRHISSSALPHSTSGAKGVGDGRYDIATNGTSANNGNGGDDGIR